MYPHAINASPVGSWNKKGMKTAEIDRLHVPNGGGELLQRRKRAARVGDLLVISEVSFFMFGSWFTGLILDLFRISFTSLFACFYFFLHRPRELASLLDLVMLLWNSVQLIKDHKMEWLEFKSHRANDPPWASVPSPSLSHSFDEQLNRSFTVIPLSSNSFIISC